MRIALLGYPQAGKRTLFSLLTGRSVPPGRKEAESVEGIAPVRDPRVDAIAKIVQPEKIKYAETIFVLCPDITDGTGGRPWMESARQCDLIGMVVRAFGDDSVYHPKGSVDAARDRSDLEAEILLADLELLEKRLERIGKEKRAGQTPAQIVEEKTLNRCRQAIESGAKLGELALESHEVPAIRSLNLFVLKPVLWISNVDEGNVREEGTDPFTVACKIEQEIMDIQDAEERKEYLATLGLTSSGLDRMNRAAYDAMGLMSFYTMGKDEVRAWTIRKGSLAPVAAGKIHSDMERGFIRAEVIKYDDLVALGSESAVKAHGKAMLKGKDYVIEDGDICEIRFNA
jgi:GTP-binding protein YchF